MGDGDDAEGLTYADAGVDIGASEAATAALVDAWLLGDAGPEAAGRTAAAAAAQNCTAEGARGALPSREDLPD